MANQGARRSQNDDLYQAPSILSNYHQHNQLGLKQTPRGSSSSNNNNNNFRPTATNSSSQFSHQHPFRRSDAGISNRLSASKSSNSHSSPNSNPISHVVGSVAKSAAAAGHYKGHQRRQSVAHLLPDISKLRLLSWLVEASNELIDCDIAIMDGVYAKLNRSRESLLFWQQHQLHTNNSRPPPPPPPTSQPVANNKFMVSQFQKQSSRLTTRSKLGTANKKHQSDNADPLTAADGSGGRNARTHHSLPSNNYDASSLAAVSWRSSKTMPADSNSVAGGSGNKSIKSDQHHHHHHHNHHHPQRRRSNNSRVESWDQQVQTSLAGNRLSVPETSNTSSLPFDLLCDITTTTTTTPAKSSIINENHKGGADVSAAISAQQADNNELDYCDSNQSDDELNSSAASSSTTSSGIHRASLSSSASSSSASSSVGSFCSNDGPAGTTATTKESMISTVDNQSTNSSSLIGQNVATANLSSAEQLSERIRQCVMRHNYLQSLLVNIIRQHDRQRDLFYQKQQHQQNQLKLSGGGGSSMMDSSSEVSSRMPLIDLTDIADSLNDGCLCFCHQTHCQQQSSGSLLGSGTNNKHQLLIRASAATPTSSSLDLFQPQSLPLSVNSTQTSSGGKTTTTRRLKKLRRNGTAELSREDVIQQLSEKLCENCFETHYWLHACYSIEVTGTGSQQKQTSGGKHRNNENSSLANQQQSTGSSDSPIQQRSSDQNALISLRNSTFIRLVQQQVRSTISKSIELIDLIRREIKSPESIKQKQLMKCFSSSIQLLSSVANYVVPSQDISSFIPEIDQQQQAVLFNLPPYDFDYLMSNRPSSSYRTPTTPASPQAINYHLATAPEIPPRRRFNNNNNNSGNKSSSSDRSDTKQQQQQATSEQVLSSNLEKLKTNDADNSNTSAEANTAGADSSSGASSNNSSASSSIARGQVQQSSLTRAHTSGAIMDGTKTSHDHISFDSFASLTRQQTEDDILYHQSSRPKFWQSSKFNFIKKLLHVRQQRLLRQQSKDRRIYNNKVQNKFRLVMMDLTHFNKSQQLLTTENGVNSLLTSMRNVLEFGLYLTVKLY